MKYAGVYFINGELLFHAVAETDVGGCIDWTPLVRVLTQAPKRELGGAVIRVLDAFTTGVRHPADWSTFRSPFLKALGEDSADLFDAKSKCCSISADEQIIQISATKYVSPGNFVCFSDGRLIEVSSKAWPEEIGQAVLDALQMCE